MSKTGKYIGISNRIPFSVIDSALYDYIQTGVINKERHLSHIKEYTKGENRANKTLGHLVAIIKRNEKIIQCFSKTTGGNDYYQINLNDRKALVLTLFCISFPIAYEMLTAFSTGFKVQALLNKQFLVQKIGAIYGGNRSMHIGVDEVIPLFMECDLIKREKVGIYSIGNKLIINNKFISELIIYTDIRLSGSKTILIEDLGFKPWFSYFDISALNLDNISYLISKKDSAVGKGYLTTRH